MTDVVARAVGWRHGVVAAVESVPSTFADLPIANWAATLLPGRTGSTSGGAAERDDDARTAAVAEAVERYCATMCPLPQIDPRRGDDTIAMSAFTLHSDAQRDQPAFPYRSAYTGTTAFTDAFSLVDGHRVLVPQSLVTLDPGRTVIATSSGLAADPSPVRAALRAVQELIERDALMTTWLHGVAARRVPTERAGSEVVCFDLTPDYSPHPVAAVAGNLPLRGIPRLSFGLACRSRWADAVDKAWLEWVQGTVFAGMVSVRDAIRCVDAAEVTDFDRHAVYYSHHPDEWAALPLWDGAPSSAAPDAAVVGRATDELRHLTAALAGAGVDTYARDVTTVDAASIGLRVVRALAPALVPIHPDHNWPHLGGTAGDLAFRYPWATAGPTFPSPHPHPLG